MRPVADGPWSLLLTAHAVRWSRSVWTEVVPLAWLMADQGIFATTNFVVNILFARWLPPVDYGLFAVSFSGYLLLTVLHFGAVLEPILVQSAQVEANRLRSYIFVLIEAHVLMITGIGILSGIGLITALLLNDPEAGLAIVGAMLGGSLMVTLLTARRLCLVFLSTRVSATIGIVYLFGVVATGWLIHRQGDVSWFDLWLVMGGWSLLCSALIFTLLYTSLSGTRPYTLGELCRFQWQYARYGLLAAICSWFRVDGVLLLLARFAGLEVIAETRAVLNIANPLIQVNLALYTSWLVIFSRHRSRRQLWQTAIFYCVGAAVLLGVMFEIAEPLVRWAYSGRYLNAAWLLPIYCLAVACNGFESVFTCFMKAIRFLRRGYAPQIIGAGISITLGYFLIPLMGSAGAIYAIVISFIIGAILALVLALDES